MDMMSSSLFYFKSASSQRMVELLGGDMSGVIGFDKVSSILYHADEISLGEMAGGMEVGEASMDVLHGGSQFQVVMKQLGKRDTTTKLKVWLSAFVSACPSVCKIC